MPITELSQVKSVRALLGKVVVKRDALPEKIGVLWLPDIKKEDEAEWTGRVMSVGKGRYNKYGVLEPIDLQPGDRISFEAWCGYTMKVQNQDFYVIPADKVYGKIIEPVSAET